MIVLNIILICITISFLVNNHNSKFYKIMKEVVDEYIIQVMKDKEVIYDELLDVKCKEKITDLIGIFFSFLIYIILLFIFVSKMIYLDNVKYLSIIMLFLIILYIIKKSIIKAKPKDINKTKEEKLKYIQKINKKLNRKLLFSKEILIILFYLIYSLSILMNLL